MAQRRNSTEAVVKKTALETNIKVGEPLEPEKVIEYECPDKEITDPIEAFWYVLQIAGDWRSTEEYFKEKGLAVWTNKEWNTLVMTSSWRICNNIIREYLEDNYLWQWAYLKKWDRELYWRVDMRPYDSLMKSPYWKIHMPLITVNSVPVFFPKNKLLTREQVNTYELYNWKSEDFDKSELEKKIMADLIRYSQLWVKEVKDAKAIFDRIQKECEKIWTVKRLTFNDWMFVIEFDWRLAVDSSWHYKPMVLPPFKIKIDFRQKTVSWEWEHPHNLHPDLCMWWELTRLKDRCFKERDIGWLVLWLVQFWNQWTSTDAWWTDRCASYCLQHWLLDTSIDKDYIMDLPVRLSDIIYTLDDTGNEDFFLQKNTSRQWFTEMLDNEWFVKELLEKISKDSVLRIFSVAYSNDSAKFEEMKEKYLD